MNSSEVGRRQVAIDRPAARNDQLVSPNAIDPVQQTQTSEIGISVSRESEILNHIEKAAVSTESIPSRYL